MSVKDSRTEALAVGIPTPNRVWLTYGRKLNLGNYESVDISMGMSTDVEPGESIQAALIRCSKEVIPAVKKRCQFEKSR